MKKKKDNRLFNYFLSVGFILTLVFVLLLFLLVSRFALSGVNPIGATLIQTKELLEDISEVEKAVNQNIQNNNETKLVIKNNHVPDFNNIRSEITDISYRNIYENKTVLTIFIKDEIQNYNNYYYIKLENLSKLEKTDIVIFENDEEIKTGTIIAIDENKFHIKTQEEILNIEMTKILGKIFYIFEE